MSGVSKHLIDVANAARPIGKDEFVSAFKATLTAAGTRLQGQFRSVKENHDRIPTALAISGGADSMALAALMRFYIYPDAPGQLPAFIVDHAMRQESSKEAEHVRNLLREKLGIQAEILRDELTNQISEHPLRKGETYARNLRFRLLESALRQRGIDKIALAHHSNDQHETILQRLAAGSRAGLTGIGSASPLARFGISQYQNIFPKDSPQPSSMPIAPLWPSEEARDIASRNVCGVFAMMESSPTALRPLLGFPKSRLVATCRHFGMEWVEDQTNNDPTFTARNAIRKVSREHRLPHALGLRSILALYIRLQAASAQCEADARRLFNLCNLDMDFRSSILKVTFPSKEMNEPRLSDKLTTVQAELLKLCFQLVRRESGIIELKDLVPVATRIFNCQPTARAEDREAASQSTRTLLGVTFRPTTPSEQRVDLDAAKDDHSNCWIFYRSGFQSSEVEQASKGHTGPLASRLPLFAAPNAKGEASQTPNDRKFHLWDGRFWIHAEIENVITDLSGYLLIRPLTPADLSTFRQMCDRKDLTLLLHNTPLEGPNLKKQLDAILQNCAPGKVRYTLPIIQYISKDQPLLSSLLALPTLGLSFSAKDCIEAQDRPQSILHLKSEVSDTLPRPRWSVLYRNADIGDRILVARKLQGAGRTAIRLCIEPQSAMVNE